jgi:hypothetical protein
MGKRCFSRERTQPSIANKGFNFLECAKQTGF